MDLKNFFNYDFSLIGIHKLHYFTYFIPLWLKVFPSACTLRAPTSINCNFIFITYRRNSGTYVQVPRPDIDLTTRPASSMSSTATIRVGMNRTAKNRAAAAGPNSMTASVEDHFPMEPIPAPPAQFNTNNEDEVNAHSESKFSKIMEKKNQTVELKIISLGFFFLDLLRGLGEKIKKCWFWSLRKEKKFRRKGYIHRNQNDTVYFYF